MNRSSTSRTRMNWKSAWITLSFVLYSFAMTSVALSDDAKLHLLAAPADFSSLGLGKQVEVREDGRRTPSSSQYFEWWYFDALLDDGTVVVVWLGDNWLYGTHKRAVDIELTSPGKPTRRIMRSFNERGSFSTKSADIKIGPHRFKGNLDTYSIHVDATETGGLGCDLVLRRRVPSYRPATGYIGAGSQFFAWLVAVPEGAVTGTLIVDGRAHHVTGSGYHDHNWGNVSPADLFDNWWWGRGLSGGHTVIASEIHGKQRVGGTSIPLFFVGDEHKVLINEFGADVQTSEGAPAHHPDPMHTRPIGSSISFATLDGSKAEFKISNRLLTSADLLTQQSLVVRLGAHVIGLKPWYTRFISPIYLTLAGRSQTTGRGTLEYFELK